MYYIYFLKSKNHTFKYIGSTHDLVKRIEEHNKGESQSTKHYAPFELVSYLAVQTREQANKLKKYFKAGSGYAFAKKRIFQENKE